jgi:uncharacterized protein (TIGR02646 family)
MIELVHGQEPIELTEFNQQNPNASPEDFDDLFSPIKKSVKTALHRDQGGLCVYCEQMLNADEGQIDHIKPKAAQQPTQPSFPDLAFKYANFAHSCINNRTCGQKKKSGVLPIEPAPNCNDYWILLSDGSIEPKANLTKSQKHLVTQTRDMLGLNADAALLRDREKWFTQVVNIAQVMPQELDDFLKNIPYRYILKTVF